MPEKLIRDYIPHIITAKGEIADIRYTQETEELKQLLRIKLGEEVSEFLDAESVEEAADILEVLVAIGKIKGFTLEQVLATREQKRNERGGFETGAVLQIP